jgi:hypothetical protein
MLHSEEGMGSSQVLWEVKAATSLAAAAVDVVRSW